MKYILLTLALLMCGCEQKPKEVTRREIVLDSTLRTIFQDSVILTGQVRVWDAAETPNGKWVMRYAPIFQDSSKCREFVEAVLEYEKRNKYK